MMLYVLDTDMLSLFQQGHPLVCPRVLSCQPQERAVTIITVEESLTGWYSLLRRVRRDQLASCYDRLTEHVRMLGQWQVLSFAEPAIQRFEQLVALKLNVGKNDLRIAAITLEHGGILVTRNRRDFQRVPGLSLEDWSV